MFGTEELAASRLRRKPPTGGRSPLLPKLLLAVCSTTLLILGVVGAEALARRLAPGYLVEARGIHVFSKEYGWRGRPGAEAPMGGGRVTLNALGYRGRAWRVPKRSGQTRVVVLGDSIAFGYGVADEQAFPQVLDGRDNGLEVVNLGVEGYGPGQELLVLRREGLSAAPDVVVLAVCLRNDFVDAVLPVALYDGVTPRPRFRLVGSSLVFDESAMRRSQARHAVQWLSDESHLFNRMKALLPRPEGEDPGWRHRKQEVLREPDYAFRLTLALVMEMEKTCRERGIGFLVATFPNGLGYGIRPELAQRFHASLAAAGVAVVDMGERFRALGHRAPALAIDSTGHLGPEGHALAGEILEGVITQRFATIARRGA
jgi:hypothetical protein